MDTRAILIHLPAALAFDAYGLLAFMLAAQMLSLWPGEVAEQWHEVICVCRTVFALVSVPLIATGVILWFL